MRISDWSSDVCSSDLEGCVSQRRFLVGPVLWLAGQQAPPSHGTLAQGLTRVKQKAGTRNRPQRGMPCAKNTRRPQSRRLSPDTEIGRAECRERVGKYVEM